MESDVYVIKSDIQKVLTVDIVLSLAGSRYKTEMNRFYHAQPCPQYNSYNSELMPGKGIAVNLENSSICFILSNSEALDLTFYDINGKSFTFSKVGYFFTQAKDLIKVEILNSSDDVQQLEVIH